MDSNENTPPVRPAAGQVWNAGDYATKASFVPALGEDVLALLAPKPGEKIIDIGCGDGALTLRLSERGADVVGLEPDPALAAAARERGLAILEADAHDAFGDAAFDAAFSNAAFHWFRQPERVLANVWAALKPGGRLVVEQGGFGNVVAIVTAIHAALEACGFPQRAACPWDFPSVTTQRNRLERAGFRVDDIALFPRPTALPAGMAGWLDTFAGPYLTGLPKDVRESVKSDTLRRLEGLNDRDEGWHADYVRLRFHAARLP